MKKLLLFVAVLCCTYTMAQAPYSPTTAKKYTKKATKRWWTPPAKKATTASKVVYTSDPRYKPKATVANTNVRYGYVDTIKNAENHYPPFGNVGIGTSSPIAAIDIRRNAGNGNNKNFLLSLSNDWAEGGLNEPTIMFNNGDNSENFSYWTLGARISGDNAHKDLPQVFKIGYKAPTVPNEVEYFSIDSYNGRVKIGYCNSNIDGYKLFVEEGILTEKVKVAVKDSEDWFDNVFEPSYKIMPIKDLEQYIATYKHLPEIPTTNDVMTNGVDLGKMNGLLLKKVEELTLYMIDIKKELDAAKKEIEVLKNK